MENKILESYINKTEKTYNVEIIKEKAKKVHDLFVLTLNPNQKELYNSFIKFENQLNKEILIEIIHFTLEFIKKTPSFGVFFCYSGCGAPFPISLLINLTNL